MTGFSLEDALSEVSAAGLSTSSEFMRYILESKIPGVHYHHADLGRSKATTMTQILDGAGSRPRLVDGAHEDHIVPGYQLNSEGWGRSHSVVLKILEDHQQGSKGSCPEKYIISELDGGIFHSKSLEYLETEGPSLKQNLKDVEKNCSMLLNIADKLEILPPANDPVPGDLLNMSRWKDSLCELIKELKTVQARLPSLSHSPRVYVLTTSPYGEFLRSLAAEIADASG